MANLTLKDLAAKMKGIDIAFLASKTENGEIATRPMSNNADVEYDGDSYYFTNEDTRIVNDIRRDKNVALSFAGKSGLVSGPSFYASVEGEAELIKDKSAFEAHWTKELDIWFEKGVDTPGLTLIKVHAHRITYWDGSDQGEIRVP